MTRQIWWISFILSVVLFGASTAVMVDRWSHQLLWGHLPLLQLSTGWISILLLVRRRHLSARSKLNDYLLGTLTAVLLALGFPPFPFPFLLMLGFIPLLVVVTRGEKESTPGKIDYMVIYHTMLLWNILSTYWVSNSASYLAGIFANTINAFLMTLPILTFLYVIRRLGMKIGLAAFVSCWLTFEFLHMRWDLYWPWLTLGNGLSSVPAGIQWYSFTGVFGGSAWILLINYLLFEIYRQGKWKVPSAYMRVGFWLLVPTVGSLVMYMTYEETGDQIEVVAVQPNMEPHYQKFSMPQVAIAQEMVSLANEEITSSTDYVVFPETSLGPINMDHIEAERAMGPLLQLANEWPELHVITGLAGYRNLTDPATFDLPSTRSYQLQSGDMLYREAYNCAIQYEEGGEIQEYYKALFVPGAEFFPFRKMLFFLKPVIDQLGGTIEGYRVRSKFELFKSDKAQIAPAICYESIFGEYMTRFCQKGANTIFIMTNDGWWDNTAGHRQHTAYAKLRAIECRRDVVRSANMGNCTFINQKGDILEITKYGEAGAIKNQVHLNNELTFYARWGDVIGRISLFLTILLIIRGFILKIVD